MLIKIKLREARIFKGTRIAVSLSFKFGSLPPTPITAIIDTGCPFSMISENTLKRTRIHLSTLPIYDSELTYLGNIKLQLRDLKLCDLIFRDISNGLVALKQELVGGFPITKNPQTEYPNLPNILGMDFLKKHSLSLSFNEEGIWLIKDD